MPGWPNPFAASARGPRLPSQNGGRNVRQVGGQSGVRRTGAVSGSEMPESLRGVVSRVQGWMPTGWAAAVTQERLRTGLVVALCLFLPLFGQTFHYIKVKPIAWAWALSKVWSLLSLLLVLRLFAGPRPEGSRQVLLSFLWLVLVPSFIAQQTFNQNFFAGLPAQVKLLSILYFFSFLALLRWWNPSLRELERAFLALAVISYIILLLLWIFAPQSAYAVHYKAGDANLLGADKRGNRIREPFYFGMLGLLWVFRKFTQKWNWRWLLLWALGFFLIFSLIRMRTYIFGMALVAAITAFRAASPRSRMGLMLVMPFAMAAFLQLPLVASIFSTSKAFAFDVRYVSTMKAVAFLGTDPLRWLFGVGTLSPVNPAAMMTYFNHFFFLADITWVGAIFEYGLLGAMLIMALPVRGVWMMHKVCKVENNALTGALQDYLIYTILVSEMFPITMAPGEVTVIMAIAVWRLEKLRRPGSLWKGFGRGSGHNARQLAGSNSGPVS